MAATMAHCQCRGVDPADMESEGIDPPYCPHGEWAGVQILLKMEGQESESLSLAKPDSHWLYGTRIISSVQEQDQAGLCTCVTRDKLYSPVLH